MAASVLEQPVGLGDVLDLQAVGALARELADLHGVGIQVLDGSGQILVRAGGGPKVDGSGGLRFVKQPLTHDGSPLGTVVVGPLDSADSERNQRAKKVAAHVRTLLAALVQAGLAHHYASILQAETVLESHREVADLHRRVGQLMERQKELDRLKANFLATMSHELRTPLTSVIGYSEMLLQGISGELPREQRDYVQTIMDKGEQLLGLVSSLIDTARAGAGTLRVRREAVGVDETVAGVLGTVKPLADRRKLRLVADVPPGLPAVVADRDKLRQVLLNLVGNAIKFSQEGGTVAVDAGTARLSGADPLTAPFFGEDDGVRMSVRDRGVGIDKQHLERIFEPFYQVDGTSTREFGGAGIGLALVRSFVTGMGGRVWAESHKGQGSTFNVVLPMQRGVTP